MKGWLGFVTDEVAAELEPVEGVESREAINFCFALGEDTGYLPHVAALADLAMKHYGFVSAESAVDGEGAGAQRLPVQGGDAGLAPTGAVVASEVGLQERVGNLEKTMSDMAANLQLVLNHLSPPAEPPTVERRVTIDPKPKRVSASGAALSSGSGAAAKSSSRPSALRKPVSTSFPSLDPGVVAAATAAGIPQETLQEMEKLMGVDLAGAKRLKEASMTKSKAAPPRKGVAGVLSESEDEETEAEGSGVDSGGNPLEASLQKLTEIVGILAMDKKKKAKTSKMEQALDGISAGSGSDASLAGGVKRAAAARRVLRQALVDHPAEVSGMLERLLMEDLTSQVQGPGMPEAAFCARAWLEHRSRIGAYRTATHCAWSIAGVWDDLYYGRIAHARARAGLLLLMLDQTAIDKGQWHFFIRAIYGARSTACFVGSSPSPFGFRRGEPFLTLTGCKMGGDQYVVSTRHRRFHLEEAWIGQEDRRHREGQGETEGQSQDKGQAFGESGRCMIDRVAEGVEEGRQVVPGSRAPSINVPALVNSMTRLVLKYGSALSTFVRSVLTANPSSDRQSAHSRPMWPIPVPYPESFMGGGGGTSGWKKRRVCLQVLLLDWLFLGKQKLVLQV